MVIRKLRASGTRQPINRGFDSPAHFHMVYTRRLDYARLSSHSMSISKSVLTVQLRERFLSSVLSGRLDLPYASGEIKFLIVA